MMREKFGLLLKQFLTQCFFPAVVLNLIIEALSRCSLWKAAGYLVTSPLIFLYNTLVIAATLSIALLFRRRTFARFILYVIWIAIGVVDFVLLQFRTTPFTAVDLLLIKSAFSIMGHYLNVLEIILILAALVLVILGCVVLWKKAPRLPDRIHYSIAVPFCALSIGAAVLATNLGVDSGMLAVNFGNLADAFHSYGLPYCFMSSLLNTGIDKPSSYSEDVVDSIMDVLDESVAYAAPHTDADTTPAPETSAPKTPAPEASESAVAPVPSEEEAIPNIIFLQLESFFDPKLIEGVEFSEDPVPYYQYLKENYSTGYFNVPSIGAGTANTEFETITGMNLDFFGPGEYPYKTILKDTTAESICYNLKTLGLSTHAIHNNDATFYDRHIVFSQLGFDTFTAIEYMNDVEETPLGWAKDAILTGEIEKALDSTQEHDFIYTISVQGHGAYPEEAILENPAITLTVPEEYWAEHSEAEYYGLLYYVNQLHEMDAFLRELTGMLENRDENTVLVLYGDHLPGFSFEEEDLKNHNLFQTQYVIWSNFDMEYEYRDVEAYQLYSYVFERLDLHEGIIPRLHQKYLDSSDEIELAAYQEDLKILQYDMLYGNQDCYDGENPHEATALTMGVEPIRILGVKSRRDSSDDRTVMVFGRNFTPYSYVYVNGKQLETAYAGSTLLIVEDLEPADGDIFTVCQIGEDRIVIGTTKEYTYRTPSSLGGSTAPTVLQ
ncbi:MAG: sulfatase-like hydrolase/transferase [Lachnospiraceae bacterium]|nr:sulfatase-like hydrolase/transferase [Lachnospiraceae bacterium]